MNLSHNLALQKDVSGIINCPIDKNLLNKNNIGVTEYLAEKCKLKKNTEVMVIGNNKLKVSVNSVGGKIDYSEFLSESKLEEEEKDYFLTLEYRSLFQTDF